MKTQDTAPAGGMRLVAFDLDGTLLTTNKELTPRVLQALTRAAEAGIELVPATGRFLNSIPEPVRTLPFLHYVITINGAQVFNVRQGFSIARAEIPLEQALQIFRYLDTFLRGTPDDPIIYDGVMDDQGYMTRGHYARIEEFTIDEHQFKMLRDQRQTVDDLKAFIQARGRSIQKAQLFTRDRDLRARLLAELPRRFPGTAVSSAVDNNIEINNEHANKGEALKNLADYLGISLSKTLAFGDGLNDISMIRTAGVGVAMRNAYPEVQAAADCVTLSCDEGGIAAGIEKFCFGEPGRQ